MNQHPPNPKLRISRCDGRYCGLIRPCQPTEDDDGNLEMLCIECLEGDITVERDLSHLTRTERCAWYNVERRGMTVREYADAAGLGSAGAVSSALQRARAKLEQADAAEGGAA